MTSPVRGEIYIVDFGEPRGSEPQGRHHAVVIQNNVGNDTASTTQVAAITSKLPKKKYPMHVWLDKSATGKKCVIQCELMLTVTKDRLIRKAGALSFAQLGELDRALCDQLHLTP